MLSATQPLKRVWCKGKYTNVGKQITVELEQNPSPHDQTGLFSIDHSRLGKNRPALHRQLGRPRLGLGICVESTIWMDHILNSPKLGIIQRKLEKKMKRNFPGNFVGAKHFRIDAPHTVSRD